MYEINNRRTTHEANEIGMISQNFFDEQLLPVIDGEGVRRTLRVQVGSRKVGVGVKVGQQVVAHRPILVPVEVRRCELTANV